MCSVLDRPEMCMASARIPSLTYVLVQMKFFHPLWRSAMATVSRRQGSRTLCPRWQSGLQIVLPLSLVFIPTLPTLQRSCSPLIAATPKSANGEGTMSSRNGTSLSHLSLPSNGRKCGQRSLLGLKEILMPWKHN